jgi:hypothetical protein
MAKLGNNTGVPLGMNLTSPGLPGVGLLDLLNAKVRRDRGEGVVQRSHPALDALPTVIDRSDSYTPPH